MAADLSADAINRMAFELSERQPIIGFLQNHRRTIEARFDMHYPLELGLVLSGRMRRYCHGWQTDLRPGQVWLCGVWEPHGMAVARAPCSVAVLVIHPPMLASARFDEAPDLHCMSPFLAPPPRRPQVSAANAGRMLDLGRRIARVLAGHPAREGVWLRLILMETLLLLTERWRPPAEMPAETPRFCRRVGPALDMVFGVSRRVAVDRAAASCGLSRSNFARQFRQTVGMSFARFSLRHRLSQAASELMRTDRPIKAIASLFGFVDNSHLNHLFRQHYGCSPAEFRSRRGDAC
ncbi:MAG: helix-turn-helix transcriptional regulator [Planctomycetes bacterium]|nr:helix-turn-helix transcriptional regulator [Planctomycetota bacterium]